MKLLHLTALTALVFAAAPALPAQCCKDKAKVQITVSKTGGVLNSALLFNDICPITGNATSAKTPTARHGDHLISLCCAGCNKAFAQLETKKKDLFVARFTGKNRRTAFPAAKAGTSTATKPCPDCGLQVTAGKQVTAKKECCDDCCADGAKKPAAKKECCADEAKKPAAKKDCCADAAKKPAAKKECCADEAKKPAAKKECCADEAKKPAAKKECCADEAKKPAAKKECCADEAKKPAAKKECCADEAKKPAAKKECCADEAKKPAAKKECCADEAKKPAAKKECCADEAKKPAAKITAIGK